MTRHCTMIVGPTGGGKTVIIHTIVKAQGVMGLPTKLTVLNPKVSVSSFKIYTKEEPMTVYAPWAHVGIIEINSACLSVFLILTFFTFKPPNRLA